MTTLNLSEKPKSPASVDPRGAEIDRQFQALLSEVADMAKAESVVEQAAAEMARKSAALSAIISDPMTFATTPDAELTAAKQALVRADQAHAEATRALDAKRLAIGDVSARRAEIQHRRTELLVETIRAKHAAVARKRLQLIIALRAAEAEELQIVREARASVPAELITATGTIPKHAGIVPLLFPSGILTPAKVGADDSSARSVVGDDLIPAIAAVYPEIVRELLPDEAPGIFDKLESDYARGSFFYAGRCNNWHVAEIKLPTDGHQPGKHLSWLQLLSGVGRAAHRGL